MSCFQSFAVDAANLRAVYIDGLIRINSGPKILRSCFIHCLHTYIHTYLPTYLQNPTNPTNPTTQPYKSYTYPTNPTLLPYLQYPTLHTPRTHACAMEKKRKNLY